MRKKSAKVELLPPEPKEKETKPKVTDTWEVTDDGRKRLLPVRKQVLPDGTIVEPVRVREAFNKYVSLGDNRSLRKLAEETGIRIGLLEQWSGKYKWMEKLAQQSLEVADSLALEPLSEQFDKKKFQLKVIDQIILDSVKLDEDGNIIETTIKAKTPSDIRTLIATRNELLYGPEDKRGRPVAGTQNIQQAVFIIKK